MKKLISFELTMPNVGSWNGIWTGKKTAHFIVKKCSKEQIEKINLKNNKNSFLYDFGDGWTACVKVERIDYTQAPLRRKVSNGFMGYEWMVDEIIELGRIKTRSERLIKV